MTTATARASVRDAVGGWTLRRAAALGLTLTALVAASTTVPTIVRELATWIRADPQETWSRAELDPDRLGIDESVITGAEAAMPRDATYMIVFGDDADAPLGERGVRQALRYYLLPRTWTDDPSRAGWVIAWGHSSELLPVRVRREIGLSPRGVNLVEVER